MGSDERALFEAFLIVDAPRQRLSHWTHALAVLDAPHAPPLTTVTARYDALADQAVLTLCYRATLRDPTPLSFVGGVAVLAEAGLIQLAQLSNREQWRFRSERLARCSFVVENESNVVGALQELVRQLRRQRNASREPFVDSVMRSIRGTGAPAADDQAHNGMRRRVNGTASPSYSDHASSAATDPSDPALLVHARGTRNELVPVRPRSSSGATIPPHPFDAFGRAASNRDRERSDATAAPVAPGEFLDSVQVIVDDELRYQVPPSLPRTARKTVPPPNAAESDAGSTIYARYLRSGKWLPIRIGSLSLRGAALMTGALPRLDDHVDITLSYGEYRALVRGTVGKVSSRRDAAVTGTSTFSVSFDLDNPSRRQLTALLTAARTANVMIKPPPPRGARRFVVEWPVCLGTKRGVIKADAFDVSLGGMFVLPTVGIDVGSTCTFSVVLDDGGGAVAGRARIVRQIDERAAATHGLTPGIGLAITDIGSSDIQRWEAFIARIETRTGKRVLIGAPPARLAKLQATLAGVGYAVLGGADPGTIIQLANADTRPVDAALIDARWLHGGELGSWVEHLFVARNVPCVTAHGNARGARIAVDKLLDIGGSVEDFEGPTMV